MLRSDETRVDSFAFDSGTRIRRTVTTVEHCDSYINVCFSYKDAGLVFRISTENITKYICRDILSVVTLPFMREDLPEVDVVTTQRYTAKCVQN